MARKNWSLPPERLYPGRHTVVARWRPERRILTQQSFNLLGKRTFLSSANLLVYKLSILEKKKGRNVSDTVAGADFVVVVHIQLTDIDFTGIRFSQFVHHGGHHFAGATPFCPKVHNQRFGGVKPLIKIRIGQYQCHMSLFFSVQSKGRRLSTARQKYKFFSAARCYG